MDKSRNRMKEKPEIRKILLPTLFEYKNARGLEDWSTGKRIWLNLIDTTEGENNSKSFSTLPDLKTKLRSTDITKLEKDVNGNDLLAVSQQSDGEYRGNVLITIDNDDEGFSSDEERPMSVTDSEKRTENPSANEAFFVDKDLGMMNASQNGLQLMTCQASVDTMGNSRKEKCEKMDSVRQWVLDQSFVDFDSKTVRQVETDHEKLPEMDNSQNKRSRARHLSEGSQSLQNKMDYNEMLVTSYGVNQSPRKIASPFETSSRLLHTRQRKSSAALTTEGFSLQPCDKDAMKVNMHETDTKIIPLIETHRHFGRRSSTPFPVSEALQNQCLTGGGSSLVDTNACGTTSKTLLKPLSKHPARSNAHSWPVLNCGTKSVTGNDLRRKSSAPRPAPLLVRSASADPFKTDLCPLE